MSRHRNVRNMNLDDEMYDEDYYSEEDYEEEIQNESEDEYVAYDPEKHKPTTTESQDVKQLKEIFSHSESVIKDALAKAGNFDVAIDILSSNVL